MSGAGRGAGPREETQEAPRGVLLHPDLADRGGAEEDAAHRPQHVHPWRPGAHLPGQDPLRPGEAAWAGAGLGLELGLDWG